MAEAESHSSDQCKAITTSGNRCSRSAREDGFCHQHDESDQTVSETETEQQDGQSAQTDEESETNEMPDLEEVVDDDEQIEAILSVRRTVKASASDLIGRKFDGVSEITANDEGWRAVVEVIERRAIPDTQDILGRYEIMLDDEGSIEGYRRLDRYRRGDTAAFE